MPISHPFGVPSMIRSSAPENPYRYRKAEVEIEGQRYDVTSLSESFTPTLKDSFTLRVVVEDVPVIHALMKSYGNSRSSIPVGITLEAPRLRMSGTCTYEVGDFITLDDGFFMVLPVRFTWVGRSVEIL